MSDWVPAHRQLFRGAKRALPRATRFILLELSHESRRTRGVLDLPVGWDTATAVHDLIGGNRDEVVEAIGKLSKTDADGLSPITIERSPSTHRILITKWADWAGPKTDAERQASRRDRYRQAGGHEESVTAVTECHDDPVTDRDTPVTAVTPTGEERRGEDRTGQEKTGEIPPAPRRGAKRRKSDDGDPIPTSWTLSEVDTAFAKKHGWSKSKLDLEAELFRAHHERAGTLSLSWAASWRTWVLHDAKYAGNRPSGPHQKSTTGEPSYRRDVRAAQPKLGFDSGGKS